jgi:hypothetical protein
MKKQSNLGTLKRNQTAPEPASDHGPTSSKRNNSRATTDGGTGQSPTNWARYADSRLKQFCLRCE